MIHGQPQEIPAMKRRYRALLAAAAVALCFAPVLARAVDFTFTVPVELVNLPPDSRSGIVCCSVHTTPIAPGTSPVGVGSGCGFFTIAGGAYRGEVTVAADANPGVDPATVTHYSCGVAFNATLRGSDHQFAYWSTAPRSTLPVAPGAPFNPRVDGPIR